MVLRCTIAVESSGKKKPRGRRPPADTTQAGGPVWYSGGKLAPDLSLPKLRHRWVHARLRPRYNLYFSRTATTSAERNALYEHAARTAAHAAEQSKNFAATGPDAAAWAAADTLQVTAKLLGNRVIRQAADAYARAARPYGRIPRPSRASLDFPLPPTACPRDTYRTAQPGSRPSPSQRPARPRGPAR